MMLILEKFNLWYNSIVVETGKQFL